MKKIKIDYKNLKTRPDLKYRRFQSEVIEKEIERIAVLITDPEIKRMFIQCFPNTLDTSIFYREDTRGIPDTFIPTGDIPAMWLRDSTNQVWPYFRYINQDKKLKNLFEGLIRRQAKNIVSDPYANAFEDIAQKYPVKNLHVPKGDKWGKHTWERKWELDSHAAFLRLSAEYYSHTHDITPFDKTWTKALKSIFTIVRKEQATMKKETVKYMDHFKLPDGSLHPAIRMRGFGYPGKACGPIRNILDRQMMNQYFRI